MRRIVEMLMKHYPEFRTSVERYIAERIADQVGQTGFAEAKHTIEDLQAQVAALEKDNAALKTALNASAVELAKRGEVSDVVHYNTPAEPVGHGEDQLAKPTTIADVKADLES